MSTRRAAQRLATHGPPLPAPLHWNFDGPFDRCCAEAEDALRRGVLLLGDVSRVALVLELSLPVLRQRVQRGDAVQPAWSRLLDAARRCGLPGEPRVRHLRSEGPLLTLCLAYRN